jgi:acetyltransferase-like isoleucine patch superfamily enzyme
MRIAFDPASPARLARFGLALPFATPRVFPAEFALEPPIHIAAEIDTARPLRIGAFTTIAGGRLRHITIGRYCTIADGVQTGWPPAPESRATTSALAPFQDSQAWARLLGQDPGPAPAPPATRQATSIGHDVWIGQGAHLAPGITIGTGAIIAPHALVLSDIPPYSIAEGHPARITRPRFPPDIAARLLALAWWRFNLLTLPAAALATPEALLAHLEPAQATLDPYQPGWYGPDDLAGLIRSD